MTIEARFRVERQGFVLDVDLALPGGGVTALFGPSGAGKTTLLRAIAGLDRHPGGQLRVGESVWQAGERFLAPHRRPIGYVFQEASLFPHLTVEENIDYGARRVRRVEPGIELTEVVELLGIEHLLGRRPERLSGGERQRVAIARALAVSPRLLLMDEPLAALDLDRKREFLPYLEAIHRELDIPVIYVSHLAEEVSRLADHLVLLEAGRALATGELTDLTTRLDLPLAHAEDAAAVVEAEVAGHDEAYSLTYLSFPGGRFSVVARELPVGSRVRLRVAARDVSLTLERQSATSILNIFPATIEALAEEGEAQTTVRLRVEATPLLARVTRKSAARLELAPGRKVWAQAKSVALLA